jgi:hypothetical protein
MWSGNDLVGKFFCVSCHHAQRPTAGGVKHDRFWGRNSNINVAVFKGLCDQFGIVKNSDRNMETLVAKQMLSLRRPQRRIKNSSGNNRYAYSWRRWVCLRKAAWQGGDAGQTT